MQNTSTSSSSLNVTETCAVSENTPVELRNICFSYDEGNTWTLNNVSLTIASGERVAIVGRNGSGKSTLAKIIAGLAAPDSGFVQLCGIKVFENTTAYADAYLNARKSIGALFQSPEDQIITTITEDDVAFGLENLQVPQKRMQHRISEALQAVHMENQRYANPSIMSGGQQQRVALAGSLATHSKLLVLDEPTSMLDTCARKDIDDLFNDLQKQGTTLVQITHRFDECERANRILLLEDGGLREVSLAALKSYLVDSQYEYLVDSQSDFAQKTQENNDYQTDASATLVKNASATLVKNASANAAISISHVTVSYDDRSPAVINDYSLNVAEGDIVAIMGENGSGKSTLAKAVCGLLKAESGSICVHSIPVTGKTSKKNRQKLRRTIGYVMQFPEQQLFAETVQKDVAYGPQNFGLTGSALAKRVDETLSLLHLEHLAEKSPFSLSGGQQRLVAIAGVLACKPRVLVLDEPTAGLDCEAASQIREILNTLHNQGVTIVIITHNLQEAKALGARIVTLQHNAPKSQQEEKIQRTKRTPLLASFDPRTTLFSCLLLMLSAFSITNYMQLGILAVVTILLTVAARIQITKLLSSLHMIIAVFIFSGLLNIFAVRTGPVLTRIVTIPITLDGIHCAILFATRFSLVIILGAIVVLTMSQTVLTEACSYLLSPLRYIGIPTQEIAIIMSLALRFLPTLSTEARAVAIAQIARGSSIRDGSFKQRIHAITALIVPGFAGVIRHADTLALALDTRCYVPGAARTHLHVWKMRLKDVALLVLTVGIVSAIIAFGILHLY